MTHDYMYWEKYSVCIRFTICSLRHPLRVPECIPTIRADYCIQVRLEIKTNQEATAIIRQKVMIPQPWVAATKNQNTWEIWYIF